MHLNEETVKCHLKGKPCRKQAIGLNIYYSENNGTLGVNLPPNAPTLGQYTGLLL